MTRQRSWYLRHALADSTWRTYDVGFRHYVRFCLQLHLPVWPLAERVLELFVTSLASSLAYKSIKVYLCGVQLYGRLSGQAVSFSRMSRLYYVLRGIRRTQGASRTRPRRAPVTTDQLLITFYWLQRTCSHPNALMLFSALTMAFFGLLRVSEYTCPSTTTFDPTRNLLLNDVRIDFRIRIAHVAIKVSKTDPFRVGAVIRLGYTGTSVCPVSALVAYLSVRPSVSGPLFVFSNGRYLTRRHVSAVLCGALGTSVSVNTHSLRIGGATALAALNTPDYVIQILGRWRSDAYRDYLQLPDDYILSRSAAVAGTFPRP